MSCKGGDACRAPLYWRAAGAACLTWGWPLQAAGLHSLGHRAAREASRERCARRPRRAVHSGERGGCRRSTMRVTTGQRVSLHQVESAATELRDGQTYFVYEHIAQARARPAAPLLAAPPRAAVRARPHCATLARRGAAGSCGASEPLCLGTQAGRAGAVFLQATCWLPHARPQRSRAARRRLRSKTRGRRARGDAPAARARARARRPSSRRTGRTTGARGRSRRRGRAWTARPTCTRSRCPARTSAGPPSGPGSSRARRPSG